MDPFKFKISTIGNWDSKTPIQTFKTDQEPSELNYMLIHWFEEEVGEDANTNANDNANGQTAMASSSSGHPIKRAFYVFPKRSSTNDPRAIGVIGGTFIDG